MRGHCLGSWCQLLVVPQEISRPPAARERYIPKVSDEEISSTAVICCPHNRVVFWCSENKQAEGGGSSQLHILVREGRYGRDEPSLGLSHRIDTTVMQVRGEVMYRIKAYTFRGRFCTVFIMTKPGLNIPSKHLLNHVALFSGTAIEKVVSLASLPTSRRRQGEGPASNE